MMATMRCDHPDIEAFIEAAKSDPARLRMFNMSVLITDPVYGGGQGGWHRGNWSLPTRSISSRAGPRDLWDTIMRNDL